MAEPQAAQSAAAPASAPPLTRWQGDALWPRSIRFALVLMAPLIAGLALGPGVWLAYAVLTSVLGFQLDLGGPARQRLATIAIGGLVVLVGGALGTMVAGHVVLTTLVLAATGAIYGLMESADVNAAGTARFFCLIVSIGALFVPMRSVDIPIVAAVVLFIWLVSVGWDMAVGMWRASTAPDLAGLVAGLAPPPRERWVFAAIVAVAVAAAFLVGKALGINRPNWAILAIVIAVRNDPTLSRQSVLNLLLGTAAGVAVALAYERFFATEAGLMIGMALAALVRWPAQRLHGALGFGAMAVFIIMLLQLVALYSGLPSHAPSDRLIDVSLGCAFAAAASFVNTQAQAWLRRRPADS